MSKTVGTSETRKASIINGESQCFGKFGQNQRKFPEKSN
jgi:hypothetical protein